MKQTVLFLLAVASLAAMLVQESTIMSTDPAVYLPAVVRLVFFGLAGIVAALALDRSAPDEEKRGENAQVQGVRKNRRRR